MAQPKTPPIRLAQHVLDIWGAEAESLGVSTPRLIATDLKRYRQLAAAAEPKLTDRQWGLLSHALDGIEAAEIMAGNDDLGLIGPSRIAAEIMDWMRGGGNEDGPKWARDLYDQARKWSPLTIAGVLLRLRGEAVRSA